MPRAVNALVRQDAISSARPEARFSVLNQNHPDEVREFVEAIDVVDSEPTAAECSEPGPGRLDQEFRCPFDLPDRSPATLVGRMRVRRWWISSPP